MKKLAVLAGLGLLLNGCAAGSSSHDTGVGETSDASFRKDVLAAAEPVVVDFYATWCGPCRMMSPVVDELSKEYSGKVKVVRLDVDQNPQVASAYGVTAIPTIAIFKNGHAVDATTGVVSKSQLQQIISRSIDE